MSLESLIIVNSARSSVRDLATNWCVLRKTKKMLHNHVEPTSSHIWRRRHVSLINSARSSVRTLGVLLSFVRNKDSTHITTCTSVRDLATTWCVLRATKEKENLLQPRSNPRHLSNIWRHHRQRCVVLCAGPGYYQARLPRYERERENAIEPRRTRENRLTQPLFIYEYHIPVLIIQQ